MYRFASSILVLIALITMSFSATELLTPSPAEASPSSAASWAMSRQGARYQWGGTGPAYDCSGLTYAAYRAVGVRIPRTSSQQYHATQRISRSQLRTGDLIFWHGHVEMYVGNGRVIGATTRRGVSVRQFGAWRMDRNVRGYGRVAGASRVSTQQATQQATTGWNHSQLLRRGSRGPAVREWQAKLRDANYRVGPVDGIFGPLTHGATLQFQTNRRIQVDGVVGPQTRRAMG